LKGQVVTNVIVSKQSLNTAFEALINNAINDAKIYVIRISEKLSYDSIQKRLYKGLTRFAKNDVFTGFAIVELNKDIVVYVASQNPSIEKYVKEAFNGVNIESKLLEPSAKAQVLRNYRYQFLNSYLSLLLHNTLYQAGFRREGKNYWIWYRNPEYPYRIRADVDLDLDTYYAYVSIDIYTPMQTLLNLVENSNGYQKLKNKTVLVPLGEDYAWGHIVDFEDVPVTQSYIEQKGQKISVYEYWKKIKNVDIDENERPVVIVEVERRGKKSLLKYPPSQVRVPVIEGKLSPKQRLNAIEKILNTAVAHFKPFNIDFERYTLNRYKYYDVISNVWLSYGNNIKTYKSPLIAIQEEGAALLSYADIRRLLVLVPSTILNEEEMKELIKRLFMLISVIFETYKLGKISKITIGRYTVVENENKTSAKFTIELQQLIEKYKLEPGRDFIVVVYPDSHKQLYTDTKRICSQHWFHSQLIRVSTLKKLIEYIKEFNLSAEKKESITIWYKENIVKRINELQSMKQLNDEDRKTLNKLKQFNSTLFNILLSINVEFSLQHTVYQRQIPQNIGWRLAEPADGEDKSIYVGFDVSRSESGGIGVVVVLYNAYGSMLNATIAPIAGEKLTYEDLRGILLNIFSKVSQDLKDKTRLVIYKDGPIHSSKELSDVLEAFNNVAKQFGFKVVDVIGVIKRSNLRVFKLTKDKKGVGVQNPEVGLWTEIWAISRFGVKARRALVIASQALQGTSRPIVLEWYTPRADKDIEAIVKEYLSMCRLNFWDARTGLKKIPLPLNLADILAYLFKAGIPIKTS
jgi:hypothetical protein